MKCHDFGQFLFNSSVFDAEKLSKIISAAKKIQPTFSTAAIFFRLVSVNELIEIFAETNFFDEKNSVEIFRSHSPEIQKKYDEVVQEFLNPRNVKDIKESLADPSVKFAQVLLDEAEDFSQFEKVLEDFYKGEISPVEKIFADWYDTLPSEVNFDYPPGLEVAKDFHEFLSDSLETTIIFSSTPAETNENLFGASVKILGAIPIIIGVAAEKNILHELASSYDKFITEDIDEDFDSVAEMLNVFTGNFTVKVASQLGIEEDIFPPLVGQLKKEDVYFLNVMCDFGNFYLYIGKEEIF